MQVPYATYRIPSWNFKALNKWATAKIQGTKETFRLQWPKNVWFLSKLYVWCDCNDQKLQLGMNQVKNLTVQAKF